MTEQAKHTHWEWRHDSFVEYHQKDGGQFCGTMRHGDTSVAVTADTLDEVNEIRSVLAAAPDTAAERDNLREACWELVGLCRALAKHNPARFHQERSDAIYALDKALARARELGVGE